MALSRTEQQIADDLLSHQLDLFRLDASLRKDAVRILNDLEKELRLKLSAHDLTEFGKQRIDSLLREIKNTISDYYAQIERASAEALATLPAIQQSIVRDTLAAVGYESALVPPIHFATAMTDVLIQGAPSAEWWSRQSDDTTFRFSNALRRGIVQGKTNQDIIAEVVGRKGAPGILEVSRHNAAALVQTSVQTVANEARLEAFKQNANIIDGLMQLSTLDSHTTDICMAYSGAEWDLDEEPINETKLPFNGGPPRHWNCRSVLVPITKSFKDLGIDIPELDRTSRASTDGQVGASTTFASFLDRKGEAFQDNILGPGRAELWRGGKITLPQLLDLKGNPLSLSELRAKYDK